MFQRKLLSLILTLGLVCLLANQVQAETASSEKDPVISLVKTIIIRDYKGLKVQSDMYEVKHGDFLAKILRERGIIDHYDAKDEVLRLIQALNPELVNPNLILPGQKLLLPIGPVEGLSDSEDEKPDQQAPKIPAFEHKVLYGERIAALLRRQGIPEKLIFNEYINLVLALNPKIKNKDIIYPGQIIKLPQFEVMWTQAVIFKETAGKKISEPAPSPAVKKPEGKQAPEIREQKIPTVQAAAQPGSRTLINRVALGLIFSRIGERFKSTGQHFLPLKSGGQISLRASTFPI
ncbi:MAG: LysM peptidoglycan-binding domain-containing protein, partial [Candidatus Adiutricales bacterium]